MKILGLGVPELVVILLVVLLCYKLDKLYPKIMRDLVAREAHGEL